MAGSTTGRKGRSASTLRVRRKENKKLSKRDTRLHRKISTKIAKHVDADIGMTNVMLNKLARILCPNLYRGLFSVEKLKSISFRPPFSIIVNVGLHFVTVFVAKNHILYFDSYGKNCIRREMCDFMAKYNCRIYYNKSKLQKRTSTHCGLYALLFAAYVDLTTKPFELYFYKRAGKKNDELCKMYLQKIVSHVNVE